MSVWARNSKQRRDVCSIGPQHGTRTVYVYHRKSPSVRIYFRGDPDEVGEQPINSPATISVRVRPKFKDSWEKRFPFFFDLNDPIVIADAADFLAARAEPPARAPSAASRRPTPEQRAVSIWDVLTPRTTAQGTITYAELAAAVGTHHRSLGRPLGLLQDYCLSS